MTMLWWPSFLGHFDRVLSPGCVLEGGKPHQTDCPPMVQLSLFQSLQETKALPLRKYAPYSFRGVRTRTENGERVQYASLRGRADRILASIEVTGLEEGRGVVTCTWRSVTDQYLFERHVSDLSGEFFTKPLGKGDDPRAAFLTGLMAATLDEPWLQRQCESSTLFRLEGDAPGEWNRFRGQAYTPEFGERLRTHYGPRLKQVANEAFAAGAKRAA